MRLDLIKQRWYYKAVFEEIRGAAGCAAGRRTGSSRVYLRGKNCTLLWGWCKLPRMAPRKTSVRWKICPHPQPSHHSHSQIWETMGGQAEGTGKQKMTAGSSAALRGVVKRWRDWWRWVVCRGTCKNRRKVEHRAEDATEGYEWRNLELEARSGREQEQQRDSWPKQEELHSSIYLLTRQKSQTLWKFLISEVN